MKTFRSLFVALLEISLLAGTVTYVADANAATPAAWVEMAVPHCPGGCGKA
jgi:hypothetical protein